MSETPLTGYDLKRKFAESDIFHWSGNNNQIYRTLLELHEERFVIIEVQYQESKPPRKIYTITETGLNALRQWVLTKPELPQFRNPLLTQLSWADRIESSEVDEMLAKYEEDLLAHVVILHEQARRKGTQAASFKDRIAEHWASYYELELKWVRKLREESRSR